MRTKIQTFVFLGHPNTHHHKQQLQQNNNKLPTLVFHSRREEEHTLIYTHTNIIVTMNNKNKNNQHNNKLPTIVFHSRRGDEHTLSHTFTAALGDTSQTNNYLLLGITQIALCPILKVSQIPFCQAEEVTIFTSPLAKHKKLRQVVNIHNAVRLN